MNNENSQLLKELEAFSASSKDFISISTDEGIKSAFIEGYTLFPIDVIIEERNNGDSSKHNTLLMFYENILGEYDLNRTELLTLLKLFPEIEEWNLDVDLDNLEDSEIEDEICNYLCDYFYESSLEEDKSENEEESEEIDNEFESFLDNYSEEYAELEAKLANADTIVSNEMPKSTGLGTDSPNLADLMVLGLI